MTWCDDENNGRWKINKIMDTIIVNSIVEGDVRLLSPSWNFYIYKNMYKRLHSYQSFTEISAEVGKKKLQSKFQLNIVSNDKFDF